MGYCAPTQKEQNANKYTMNTIDNNEMKDSQTPQQERLNILKQLMPEIFDEGQIDFEKLKATLGENITFSNERYVLNWAGKSDAFRVMQCPSSATLVPCKEESVDFDTTQNIFIEGENMEVLKVLQKSYFGKVKMIYIDPPYNTGNDSFIYPDKFSETKEEYMKRVGDKDAEGYMTHEGMFRKNSRENGQYHSNWLNMMMPRLYLAKSLLREDGVILINMDEHEITNLQYLMNEIFGEDNDLGTIVWDKRNPKGDATGIAYQHEYIVVFSKNIDALKEKCQIVRPKKNAEKILAKANEIYQLKHKKTLEEINVEFQNWIKTQKDLSGGEAAYNRIDENGDVYRLVSMAWPNKKKAPDEYFIPLKHPITNKDCPVPARGWRNPPQTMNELLEKGQIIFGADETTQPQRKYLLKENLDENIPSLIYYGGSDVDMLEELGIPFDTPKVVNIIKEHIQSFTERDSIILDFFAGSGTTAHAIMQLNKEDGSNRKFICVQLPELCDLKSEAYKAGYSTIAEISKERIRRAGAKIRAEVEDERAQHAGEISFEETTKAPMLDLGFKVFKLSESNFKQWREIHGSEQEQWKQQTIDFLNPVAENATIDNMVYELLLKNGKSLNSVINHINNCYIINDGELILLLESADQSTIDYVLSLHSEKVIALDNLFAGNDQLKTNTALQLRDAGITFKTI
jgi:adenine-specific DNA-methyltransferase